MAASHLEKYPSKPYVQTKDQNSSRISCNESSKWLQGEQVRLAFLYNSNCCQKFCQSNIFFLLFPFHPHPPRLFFVLPRVSSKYKALLPMNCPQIVVSRNNTIAYAGQHPDWFEGGEGLIQLSNNNPCRGSRMSIWYKGVLSVQSAHFTLLLRLPPFLPIAAYLRLG